MRASRPSYLFRVPRATQEVFPKASVETECTSGMTVTISSGGTKVVAVGQKDLYAKYRWPAAGTVKQHLELFKEHLEED